MRRLKYAKKYEDHIRKLKLVTTHSTGQAQPLLFLCYYTGPSPAEIGFVYPVFLRAEWIDE
ncbi:hypothetical protein [Taibaiella helva]|uniref:hypothetical protein n=1 Tax=Taibaiella helva TaxID=2301235 RepID=UPI0013006B6D|nr:hypothetical protein [Taibaiella helva]